MRKNQKGITLIALIITIIVMLILVAVTISVALNGGLFSNARKAAEEMQLQADREQLFTSVVYASDYDTGNVDKEKLASDLGNNWKVEGNGPYTCISPNGNVFTVKTDGEIVENNVTPVENEVQTAGLKYMRVYMTEHIQRTAGNTEYTTAEAYVFLEDYDKCLYCGDVTIGGIQSAIILPYSYNEETNELTINNVSMNFEDNTIEDTSKDLEYTLTDISYLYNPQYIESIDLYTGIYYNNELNKMIKILPNSSNSAYYITTEMAGASVNFQDDNTLEQSLNDSYNVTVQDSTTLIYDSKEFVLLESISSDDDSWETFTYLGNEPTTLKISKDTNDVKVYSNGLLALEGTYEINGSTMTIELPSPAGTQSVDIIEILDNNEVINKVLDLDTGSESIHLLYVMNENGISNYSEVAGTYTLKEDIAYIPESLTADEIGNFIDNSQTTTYYYFDNTIWLCVNSVGYYWKLPYNTTENTFSYLGGTYELQENP